MVTDPDSASACKSAASVTVITADCPADRSPDDVSRLIRPSDVDADQDVSPPNAVTRICPLESVPRSRVRLTTSRTCGASPCDDGSGAGACPSPGPCTGDETGGRVFSGEDVAVSAFGLVSARAIRDGNGPETLIGVAATTEAGGFGVLLVLPPNGCTTPVAGATTAAVARVAAVKPVAAVATG